MTASRQTLHTLPALRCLGRDARLGQMVTIKLEAYPFTRHGALSGVVEHVSADAIADEARGLVFPARIVVTEGALRGLSDGQIPLSPGMAAKVDVRTGQRTVMGYLLSQIARATCEAGRGGEDLLCTVDGVGVITSFNQHSTSG